MRHKQISARQFQIIEPLAFGKKKKEVADKLHLSVYTVETTVKNVYVELGISSLAELTMWYCGVMFDIAKEISDKKKEVLSITGFLICMSFCGMKMDVASRNTRSLRTCIAETAGARTRTRRRERSVPIWKIPLKMPPLFLSNVSSHSYGN